MPNEEYNKNTLKIFDDCACFIKKIKDDIESLQITNIGELFILNIHKGLCLLNETTPSSEIVKEAKNVNAVLLKKVITDEEILMYKPPVSDEYETFMISSIFNALKFVVNKWENIEDILLNFGLDPQTFISSVNTTNISEIKERHEKEKGLINKILSIKITKLPSYFIVYISFAFYRNVIINAYKEYPQDIIFIFLKLSKYIGEKYSSVYKERILKLSSLWKKILSDGNKIIDILKEYGLDNIINLGITESSTFKKNIHVYKSDEDIYPSDKIRALYADLFFTVYHLIYKCPQKLIKIAFSLMSDKVSPQLQEAMFKSFSATDYNTLIQYEYEWWRRKTGQTLDIPYPFSTEPFDKNNTTIVDYDLDDVKYNTNKFINQHKTSEIGKSDEQSTKPTRDEIIKKLEKYFNTYEDDPVKGERFITDYLDDVIELSEDITDNYKSYGFAYILFHSKYFDWKKDKFNLKFVELIEPIFGIQIIERKGKYYPKDGLKKTKEILNIKKYKKLYGLLDDETKRRLKDKS